MICAAWRIQVSEATSAASTSGWPASKASMLSRNPLAKMPASSARILLILNMLSDMEVARKLFRGADGREFGAYVGRVFLEDYELFLGAADDLAVEPRSGGIKAGAAPSCFSNRATTFGAFARLARSLASLMGGLGGVSVLVVSSFSGMVHPFWEHILLPI